MPGQTDRLPLVNAWHLKNRAERPANQVTHSTASLRYNRSVDNLREILALTDFAHLFDDSGKGHIHVARFEEGLLRWRNSDARGWLERVLG